MRARWFEQQGVCGREVKEERRKLQYSEEQREWRRTVYSVREQLYFDRDIVETDKEKWPKANEL